MKEEAPKKGAKKKRRLDELVVERGFADSVDEARRLIMAGEIFSGSDRLAKPGVSFPEDVPLEDRRPSPWASRGAGKLLAALEAWPDLVVSGRTCADLGSSTGGFVDVLLQRGARLVWAVDVGRGLLHNKLRSDPRVRLRESVNARLLPEDFFAEAPPSLLVADLSFISLKAVLPRALEMLQPEAPAGPRPEAVVLMKPQFEAPRDQVGRGGVIRDDATRQALCDAFATWEPAPGWRALGWTESPVRGPAGNIEYLFRYGR